MTSSYAAGTLHATFVGTWLPDHSFQQADENILQSDAWALFGGVDGSRFSVVEGTRVDLTGVTALLGVARKITHRSGSLLLGGFLDGSFFRYKVDGINYRGLRVVGGTGDSRTIGVGLMARETLDNGVRLEATARAGRLYNEFTSGDYYVGLGYRHDYRVDTSYFGGHLGIGYTRTLNPVSSLDFVLRGYFTRVLGARAQLQDAAMDFSHTDSWKARGGARYSRRSSENVNWYAGAYYEREFDHEITATHDGLEFGAPAMSGGTGIFEIGLETHPSDSHPDLSFAFGFQGYVGELRGISGGVRLGYEF
jgi:hypothetical protein